MKRYIFLLIALLSLSVSAQNVSKEQARQTAMKFLKDAGVQSKLASLPAKAPAAKGASADAPLYYVFNAEDGKAHAIVSAVHNEVIAYSPTNAINSESMPDNMKWYMEVASVNGVIRKSAKNRRDVSPLVSAVWGQGADVTNNGKVTKEAFAFNDQCPVDPETGKKCYTGCVPTALGQIMKKWNYPSRTSRTIPGYTPNRFDYKLEDLSPTNFDWSSMKNEYFKGDKGDEVTTLMKYLGWACRADFGSKGTACVSSSGETAVNLYFDYYGNFLSQEKVTEEEWDEIVYNEVNSGRPVYMGGKAEPESGATDASGHCFIADGYDKDSRTFHMNWGWDAGNFKEWVYLFKSIPHTSNNIDMPYYIKAGCMVGMVPRNKVSKFSIIDTNFELCANDVFHKFGKIGIATSPYVLPSEAFKYKSLNISVATVSARGMITAVGEGETDIEVTLGEIENNQYCPAGYTPLKRTVHVKVVNTSPDKTFASLTAIDKFQTWNNRVYNENTWGISDSELDVNGDGVIDANDGNVLKEQYINVSGGSTTEGGTFAGGYEYVDLGLPSGNKWATKNIGAACPEDAGYYFAWGEENTKNKYLPETSYTYQKNSDALIITGMAKEVNGRMQFTRTYDAAAQIWRSNWVAPTSKDMQELTEKCDWYWERLNGEYGYRVVGPNGNTIFLPAGGRKNLSTEFLSENGCYWLNDASLDDPTSASGLYFTDSQYSILTTARFHGFNMRAIIKGKEDVYPEPSTGDHEYVDLGLPSGNLWATCNVGASSPEEVGKYYAWGETKPKSTYTWENYFDTETFNDRNGEVTFRKYKEGGPSSLQPENDVAHVEWGGDWRMPSQADCQELLDYCQWEPMIDRVNGDYIGAIVTGPNGNSIYLPNTGEITNDKLDYTWFGHYWTSDFHTYNGVKSYFAAMQMQFYIAVYNPADLDDYQFVCANYGFQRYTGMAVRPVCPSQRQQ